VTRRLGIETLDGYIFGHIGDTCESVISTAKLATKMVFDKIVIGIMVPWPGTEVYNCAVRGDSEAYELVSKDWRDFDKHFGSSIRFKKFPNMYLPRVRFLTYVGFYLRQFRLLQLTKDVLANLDVLGRFAWTSIFGASRKVDRRTELQTYLETERPDLLADYREGSDGAGHKKLDLQNQIEDGKWGSALSK
jgi:hypothetical protein